MAHKITLKKSEQSHSTNPKNKLYVFGGILIAVLMVGTSFGIMISAQTPSIPTVIEPGSMISESSFIVFKDGSSTFVRNGATGAIDFSASDDATAIQYAIDNCNMQSILLKAGDYNVQTPLLINHSHVKIIGEAGQYSTRLVKSANIDLLTIHGVGRISFLELQNLYFFGNSPTYTGRLLVVNTTSQAPSITNCHFNDNNGSAIHLYDVWGQGPIIRDCKIYNCGNATDAGVEIVGGCNAIRFENVGLAPFDYIAIHIDSISSNIIITDCTSESNAGALKPMLFIEGFSNIVSNNEFSLTGPNVALIEDDGDRNVISNNILSGGSQPCYGIYFHGTRSVIEGNYIYNAKEGIRVEDGWATVSNNFIESCTNGINSSGILLASGNHIQSSSGDGVFLDGGGSSIINANLIENSGTGTTPAVFSGLVLNGSSENLITNNRITDWRAVISKTQEYGIKEVAPAQSNWIYDNYLAGNSVDAILKVGSTTKIHNNIGFTTENHGTYVCNGNGSTAYYIPHGLVATATYFTVTPTYGPDAIGGNESFFVWADATCLIVQYSVAPPGGTNNIRLVWYAEVYH